MIGYLDTSAFVPLLVQEPTTAACQRFWNDTDDVVSNRLLYVEAAAALARALRMGRLSLRQHGRARALLDDLWAEVAIIEVSEQMTLQAAELAHRLDLRGYDAVHCASAEQLNDPDLVAASGDQRLLDAWSELGLHTYNTHGQA